GDGFDDLIIGAYFADASGNAKQAAGESYVIFGNSILPSTIVLSNLGSAGITIFGADEGDLSGCSVSGAGDINGDGFDDLIIGARGADALGNAKPDAGETYVIFGGSTLPSTIDLTNLGSADITIFGADAIDESGRAVSGAGDVNGDGFDDLIIGAFRADALGNAKESAGESYVIFGASSLPTTIHLSNPGSAGVTIFGAGIGNSSGGSVSDAGDVNGDGFDDLIIGARNVRSSSGESYVVFGGASLPVTIDVANLGPAGITIFGIDAGDLSGNSVSGAGDVNGDGFDDLIIGALHVTTGSATYIGESYVIFGRSSFPANIELANIGIEGITIFGSERLDRSGGSVSNAGDVNGDGFDDLIIGAYLADALGNAKSDAGESYVIFGGNDFTSSVTHLGTPAAETLTGTIGVDAMNGDRDHDTLVGNGGADVLIGGQGNDVLAVSDMTFKRIVGGTGDDTLRLDGSGMLLDLTTLADNRLFDVESIDIRGSGANTLTLNLQEVRNISDASNTLVVRRGDDDTVNIGIGWIQQANETIDSAVFNVFQQGNMTLKVSAKTATAASIAGRRVFFNNSFFDGNTDLINAGDDGAIAADKVALRNGTASLANYTHYSRGINGIVIDIASIANALSATDFEFRIGNTDTPDSWAIAPVPKRIMVRTGAGTGGSSRVTLVWPDNAIEKTWLRVTVKANANTGLTAPDVFYFGNAIGDIGNSPTDSIVNATDIAGVVSNQNSFLNPAPLTSPYDFNHDRQINATDIALAVSNQTSFINALRLISLPSGSSAARAVSKLRGTGSLGLDSIEFATSDPAMEHMGPPFDMRTFTTASMFSDPQQRTQSEVKETLIHLPAAQVSDKRQHDEPAILGTVGSPLEAILQTMAIENDGDFVACIDEIMAGLDLKTFPTYLLTIGHK
ncbi:MAG: integrin alpha, partial [Pirellula sp.]